MSDQTLSGGRPLAALALLAGSVFGAGCEIEPATPSDSIVVPYQFNIEFAIEQEPGEDHTARARLYDIAQAYDVTGNAGTIELAGGDALFADGTELDIETRTVFLDTQRVDYSQRIEAGKADYLFELRRPDEERIEATIPPPPEFVVDDIVEVTDPLFDTEITWSPAVDGATIDITILPLDDGCLTVIGGGAGDVVRGLDDTGSYDFDTNVYHAVDHDCSYELTFTRRSVKTVPGRWFNDGRELPANGVYAIGLHTVRMTFVAKQR